MFKKLFDFLFPKFCLCCNLKIESENCLCDKCFAKITLIKNPFCNRCGYPYSGHIFERDVSNLNKCVSCRNKKFPFYQCQSVMVYDEYSKSLILPFKHADKAYIGKYLGYISYAMKKDFIEEVDFIIPVPLHYKRLLKRKYNQAGILANVIGGLSKKPVFSDIILRQKFLGTQKSLSFLNRRQNIKNAFVLKNFEKIKGKNILIIDDVMATGSTVFEMAKVLKDGGMGRIYILTVARTIL